MPIYSMLIVNVKYILTEFKHLFITISNSLLIDFDKIPFTCLRLGIILFHKIMFHAKGLTIINRIIAAFIFRLYVVCT